MSKHVAKEILSQNDAKIKTLLEKLQNQLLARFHDLESNVLYSDSCILDPRFKKGGFRTPEAFERALGRLRRRTHTNYKYRRANCTKSATTPEACRAEYLG